MRKLLIGLVLVVGCATPAEDYIRAEAQAWREIDKHLDRWIDTDPQLKPIEKEALHLMNAGRKARVARALAEIGYVGSSTQQSR